MYVMFVCLYVWMYVGAPHTMDVVCAPEWNRSYSRETAAFPAPWCNPALPSGNHTYTRLLSEFGHRKFYLRMYWVYEEVCMYVCVCMVKALM